MPKKPKTGDNSPGGGPATSPVEVDQMNPPAGGITVRMYNTGFGDCFLLAFRGDNGEIRYMLIDCGVHQQWKTEKERIQLFQDVVTHIRDTCSNTIHLLAVSHEHADHIYGFKYAHEIFRNMTIEEIWLPWTEDKTDPVAHELDDQYGKYKAALNSAISRLAEAGNPYAEPLRNLSGFELRTAESKADLIPDKEIMNTLRSWCNKKPLRPEDYLFPGNSPREIPGVSSVRCYIMGPPHDIADIKKSDPEKETYYRKNMTNAEQAFMAAVIGMSGSGGQGGAEKFRGYPFDEAVSVTIEEAESADDGFFQIYYGFSDGEGQGESWRRIDNDWLEGSTIQLALTVGSYTNNTSLVLAFELADSGKVLLFPGDAQAGNWLSWIRDPKTKGTSEWDDHVDGERLLNATVFYKVGHHGSWNATMKQKGLEMMNKDFADKDLVAMIPVDQVWAEKRKWHHPDPNVLPELMQHARGRVLRSDDIPGSDSMNMPKESLPEEWKAFLDNVQWDKSGKKLWIQYTVS